MLKKIDSKMLEDSFVEKVNDLPLTSSGKGADSIGLPDPDSLFTAKNVGGALRELFTNVSNGKNQIATAITDKGVNAAGSDTFPVLASKIGQIQGGGSYSGTVTSSSSYVEFEGPNLYEPETTLLSRAVVSENLGFVPSAVILFSNHDDSMTISFPRVIAGIGSIVVSRFGEEMFEMVDSYTLALRGEAYVNEYGFSLPVMSVNTVYDWVICR